MIVISGTIAFLSSRGGLENGRNRKLTAKGKKSRLDHHLAMEVNESQSAAGTIKCASLTSRQFCRPVRGLPGMASQNVQYDGPLTGTPQSDYDL